MAGTIGSRRLTKRTVGAIKPGTDRFEVWDEDLAGFGLRVETSGTKTFIVRYRADGGGRKAIRRKMKIGRYGTITPEEARRVARRLLASVAATGDDPAAGRTARRREMTIGELLTLYEAKGCMVQRGKRQGIPMKPTTRRYTLARLNHHVVPLLGSKRVSDIRGKDIARLVADIAAGKTAKDVKTGTRIRIIVRGGEGAARKVARDLSAVFTFAQRQEIVRENPCEHAPINKTDNQRKRFLTLEEVKSLGAALIALEAEGANPKALNIARLWALTGCRRNEIAALKWSEVDSDRMCLVLGDSKTGFSVRPLGAPALALLACLPRTEGATYVFPSERGESFYQGFKRVWPLVAKKAKLFGITPHTLRHTLGSTAVSSGETLAMTGAILGHAKLTSTQIYAHMQTNPSLRVANRVTGAIDAALKGHKGGTVVPLKRKTRGP